MFCLVPSSVKQLSDSGGEDNKYMCIIIQAINLKWSRFFKQQKNEQFGKKYSPWDTKPNLIY